MNWLNERLIGLLLPVVMGPITYLVGRWLLNLTRWIDELPPAIKRAVVVGLGMVLAMGAQAAGVALPGECASLTSAGLTDSCTAALSAPGFLKGVVAALVAMLIHAAKKADPKSRALP